MFAVPGWTVPTAALKKQVGADQVSASKKPLERQIKSSHTRNGPGVTIDNLAELWDKHIEGKFPGGGGGIDVLSDRNGKGKKRKRDRSVNHEKGETEASREKDEDQMSKADGRGNFQKRKTLKEKKRERKRLLQPREENGTETQESKSGGSPGTGRHKLNALDAGKVPQMQSTPPSSLTVLQSTMRQKLLSSRFRYLNQTLYTTPSTSSLELFAQNPGFFAEYHEGFRRQVSVWPENPVDGFIEWIQERGALRPGGTGRINQTAHWMKRQDRRQSRSKTVEVDGKGFSHGIGANDSAKRVLEPLPRNSKSGLCTIADLGCGDAHLARVLTQPPQLNPSGPPATKALKLRIHSFDLAASSPLVTVADIRSLPLPDASVDVAVLCLALMGTNWIEFIEEAWRVLRWKGECWIGEVGSRFTVVKAKIMDHGRGDRSKGKRRARQDPELTDGGGEEMTLVDEKSSNADHKSTDISAFVEVLRRRGFVLAEEAERGNKMFVRMRFLKAVTPTAGQALPIPHDAGAQSWAKKRLVESDTIDTSEEGKVLKPCVYKTR